MTNLCAVVQGVRIPTDTEAATHGLPACLRIPIAASGVAALHQFVGKIDETKEWRGRVNAVRVLPYDHPARPTEGVALWESPNAADYLKRLHPPHQIWVHVDYTRYRRAYIELAGPIRTGQVLDHVENRRTTRLRGYRRPYLRLAPVTRQVNLSGGSRYGAEGMERANVLDALAGGPRPEVLRNSSDVRYADPIDITKMLNIPPGLDALRGVGEIIDSFYPR